MKAGEIAGHNIHILNENETAGKAARLLADGAGGIAVTGPDDTLTGFLTAADLIAHCLPPHIMALKCAAFLPDSEEAAARFAKLAPRPVREVMRRDFGQIRHGDGALYALAEFAKDGSPLPVSDENGRPVGLLDGAAILAYLLKHSK